MGKVSSPCKLQTYEIISNSTPLSIKHSQQVLILITEILVCKAMGSNKFIPRCCGDNACSVSSAVNLAQSTGVVIGTCNCKDCGVHPDDDHTNDDGIQLEEMMFSEMMVLQKLHDQKVM